MLVSLEKGRIDDVAVHEEPGDCKADGEDLESAIGDESPATSTLHAALGYVLADLGDVQRHIRRVQEHHRDTAHMVPTIDVGYIQDQQRHSVVQDHLQKVLSLRLNEDGENHHYVAAHVHDVEAPQI